MCPGEASAFLVKRKVGCIYLAQTASLSDIVLNAVALAFVLEVDDLVAQVFLTEKPPERPLGGNKKTRLRHVVSKIRPVTCGKTTYWLLGAVDRR